MEWSNETILQFLDCYQDEPIIWNPKHANHKIRHDVYDAWKRIEIQMDKQFSVSDLKKKKESLMASFRHCLLKVKQSFKSGTEDVYKPVWFAYDKMASFLVDSDEPWRTISSQENEANENENGAEPSSAMTLALDREDGNEMCIKVKSKKENPRKKIKYESTEESNFLTPKTVLTVDEDDQFQFFGKFVVTELRNLSSDYLRKKMKRRIHQVIIEICEEEEQLLNSNIKADVCEKCKITANS